MPVDKEFIEIRSRFLRRRVRVFLRSPQEVLHFQQVWGENGEMVRDLEDAI